MHSAIRILAMTLLATLLAACGGGSSDPTGTGSVTILLGDGPLDGVDEVNIDIDRIVLLGADGQTTLTEDATPGPINLLALRNVTELLADVDDVPPGTYSKIRLYISSLEVVRTEDPAVGPVAEDVQLPANGKIDLNPQGPFEISPAEDLVIQIDLDLARSVHVVQTGNSSLRFRPVVFIQVLDQRANLRLTHLFGEMNDVSTDAFDLCDESDPTRCTSVDVLTDALELPAAGDPAYEPADGDLAHVFGHFVIGAQGGVTFRALAVVLGAEDTVGRIDGLVTVVAPDDASIATIGDYTVDPVPGALLLDGLGSPITGAEDGDFAESWAQVDPAAVDLPDPFPSFLTQVGLPFDDDVVEGALIDIDGNTLTVRTSALDEVCVTRTSATQIQQVDGFGSDAENMILSFEELSALPGEPAIAAFGTLDGGTPECLVASVIVVET